MGSLIGKEIEKTFEKQQQFMLKQGLMQMERQIQMQNQMREKMMAMQMARARDMFTWWAAFYGTYLTVAVIAARRSKAVLAPALPFTFVVAYNYDLAYGSKMQRMREEADRIIDQEQNLLQLPHGIPTIATIEEGRLTQQDDARRQSNDIFL